MLNEQELAAFRASYDWQAAFSEAINHDYRSYYDQEEPQPIDNVRAVHHCVEGENDGDSWVAIGEWSDGKFFVMEAGCDYTGWDCRASGTIEFHDSLGKAMNDVSPETAKRLGIPHDANKSSSGTP